MAKKISIKNYKPDNIINDLSNAFGNEYSWDHHQVCLQIPDKYGSGYIKGYNFDHGVSVIETDCVFDKDVEIVFERGKVHVLKFIYCLDNSFSHKFSKDDDYTEINRLENIITSDSPINPHRFKIKAGTALCILIIDVNRKLFEKKIESFINDMSAELVKIFRDVNGVNTFYHKNYYSLEVSKFINDFKECEHSDFINKVFLEGKSYEIISDSLRQYVEDFTETDQKTLLRSTTKKKVEEAVRIIKEEIDHMDNVSEIAKRVRLNSNTLQKAFKTLYKTSVNEYIRNYRIEKARDLIENSDANITEISYQIGINSRSYFSKIFKDYYGITPKKYADQFRNNGDDAKSA